MLQEIGFPQKDPTAKEDLLLRELTYRLADQNRPVKTLVVMDNVESLRQTPDWPWFEKFLKDWADRGQRSRVLVTTRLEAMTASPLELGGLSEAEGAAFLQREGLTGDRIVDLIELASGHPLLLKLAAAWVRQTAGAAVDAGAIAFFSHLFEQYREDADSLAEAKVELIFEQVFEALPEGWQELLLRVSMYRLPFDLAMAQAMLEAVTVAELQTLVERALLVAEGERFTLHPLAAELVRQRVPKAVRGQAHDQAMTYYLAHTQPWDGTIASCQEELEAFYHNCELGQYNLAYQVLNRCFELLYQAGYWRNLLPFYQRLTQQWQAADEAETKNLGWAWTRLGNLYQPLGDTQAAIASHKQAQALFKSLAFQKGEAASLGNLGVAFETLGQYQQAIEFHEQQLGIMREINDFKGVANAQGGLGNAYFSLGQYQQAIAFYDQQLDISREIGDRNGEADALGGQGNAYFSLRKYQQAITFYNQQLDISREIDDRGGAAASLGNLGSAYHSLGQYQWAIKSYQQSLGIKQEIGDCRGEAIVLWNLACLYRQRGQFKRAIHPRHQSYRVWHDMQLPLTTAPFSPIIKTMAQSMGDDWAKKLIADEKAMAWLFLSRDHLTFGLRTFLSSLTRLPKALNIKPLVLWFALGIALVLLIAWLR